MATRRDLTKAYAREYQRAPKKGKGVMLDEVVRRDRLVARERMGPMEKGYSDHDLAATTTDLPVAADHCMRYPVPELHAAVSHSLRNQPIFLPSVE